MRIFFPILPWSFLTESPFYDQKLKFLKIVAILRQDFSSCPVISHIWTVCCFKHWFLESCGHQCATAKINRKRKTLPTQRFFSNFWVSKFWGNLTIYQRQKCPNISLNIWSPKSGKRPAHVHPSTVDQCPQFPKKIWFRKSNHFLLKKQTYIKVCHVNEISFYNRLLGGAFKNFNNVKLRMIFTIIFILW